jgi:hypothetical protein
MLTSPASPGLRVTSVRPLSKWISLIPSIALNGTNADSESSSSKSIVSISVLRIISKSVKEVLVTPTVLTA